MNKYIGIDIGGTDIKYGLIDEEGNILHKDKVKTGNKGDKIIQNMKQIVSQYQKLHQIQAVGVSVPGVVEKDGFMTTGGAIFDFYGVHLKEILEKELQLPVVVENDANSAALAEKWLGAGKQYSNYFTVVVGTGIGGAMIINDEIFRGAHSTAGEFGFMIVESIKNEDTRLASLSLTGSVQAGLVQGYIDKGNSSYTYEELNGKKVFDLANEGDSTAVEVIDAFYQKLAMGLFNITTAFDPEIVLVGGGISSNNEFIAELNKRVQALKKGHRDMENMTLSEIKACHFLNDAGIVGATFKAIKEYSREEINIEERATNSII